VYNHLHVAFRCVRGACNLELVSGYVAVINLVKYKHLYINIDSTQHEVIGIIKAD